MDKLANTLLTIAAAVVLTNVAIRMTKSTIRECRASK